MNFHQQSKNTIPLKTALVRIVVYTCLISGTAALALLYYFHLMEVELQDERYTLSALAQKGGLHSLYIAELLHLSVDQPTHFHHFNAEEGQKKLLASPVIQAANVEKIRPSTLSVSYTARQPIAYLGDFTNTAIDAEGVFIPVEPFFHRGALPGVYVGGLEAQIQWGERLRGDTLAQARELLGLFDSQNDAGRTIVRRIDLSKVSSPSCGTREIVVVLDEVDTRKDPERRFSIILRLNPENIPQQLANYHSFKEHLVTSNQVPKILDLRIPQLAYLN